MSLDDLKKQRGETDAKLVEVMSGIQERTAKARELNALNYKAIDLSRDLRGKLAEMDAAIAAEESRIAAEAASKTE